MNREDVLAAIVKAKERINAVMEVGVPLWQYLEKIDKALALVDSEEVSITLLGSFSDGKTTVISGLIGQVMDNMKIDVNESSDEIVVYEAPFLGKKFRFVDTPGLFGTKDKISNAGTVNRLSAITEDYISQTNAVIYVTDASNPLPESHQDALRYVMRDLRKLDFAIFVINKMDEKYDTLDNEEFADGTRIKTQNLRERLIRCLNLTDREVKELKIVCIAANPAGLGLEHWFDNKDEYADSSHIQLLQDTITSMTETMDGGINAKTAFDTAIDVIDELSDAIYEAKQPVQKAIDRVQPITRDLNDQLEMTRDDVSQQKRILIQSIEGIESDVKSAIQSMSQDTAYDVLNNIIGLDDNGDVGFSIVLRRIDNAISSCSDSISNTLERVKVDILEKVTLTETLITDALSKGAGYLKNVKISPEFVGKVRDMFFKNFKFKPWGKINLAKNLTKWLNQAATVLQFGMELWDWYKKHKQAKQFEKAKQELMSAITNIFNDAHTLYRDNETFLNNFAPGLIQLQKLVEQKNEEIESLRSKIAEMDEKRNELLRWKEEFIEDVEFTEL